MLTDGEIAWMREELELAMPDEAIILTATDTSDGQGGNTQGWTAAGTVPCRLSPRVTQMGQEPGFGDRQAAVADWIVTLPAETALTEEQRLQVDTTVYDVTRVRAPRSWELSCRADLTKIT